jgi:hypothetical protein
MVLIVLCSGGVILLLLLSTGLVPLSLKVEPLKLARYPPFAEAESAYGCLENCTPRGTHEYRVNKAAALEMLTTAI